MYIIIIIIAKTIAIATFAAPICDYKGVYIILLLFTKSVSISRSTVYTHTHALSWLYALRHGHVGNDGHLVEAENAYRSPNSCS